MSLGSGLGKLKGKVFRIGHLGDFNDLMLAGTLSGVEMGLAAAGVPFTRGGTTAALEYLAECNPAREETSPLRASQALRCWLGHTRSVHSPPSRWRGGSAR